MKKSSISSVALVYMLIDTVSSLQCYVCNNQDGNEEKCLYTIKTCAYNEDRCMSTIRWSTTPYWTQGAEKQYYVSKMCATEAQCTKEIKDSMTLCHYIWYEDWKCAECCQGDRCNYYITLGSGNVKANLLLIGGLVLSLFMLWRP